MYNSSGNVTTNILQSVKNVYNITVLRSLAQASTNYVNFQKVTTKSTLQFLLPRSAQLSNLPLKGSFVIQCILQDGITPALTADIGVKNSTGQIITAIGNACPNYKEKIELWDAPTYGYYDDGRDFYIRFLGLNYDIPQMQIFASNLNPIIANGLNFGSSTQRPYDPTLIMYEPLPFEFVHTNETQAQVLVSVNGLPAVCASNYCGYSYMAPVAQITDFTISGSTLTIIGSSFLSQDNLVGITLGNHQCTITSVTSTQILCTVTAVAGSWQPVLTDVNGIVPVTTAKFLYVPLIVTSVTPNSGLNPTGGNTIQITGQNFPASLHDAQQLSVTLSNGSPCQISNSSYTVIYCLTGPFDGTSSTSTVTLEVNLESDSSSTVSLAGTTPIILSIDPTTASPVLKTPLTLHVNNFIHALV